jgi:predicted Zn-dependent protease
MTLEHRAATPGSITYDEFVQAILAGRIEEAIRELREVAAIGVHHLLLEDSHFLERIAYSLAFSWGLREEAVRVIEFDAELHPTSARAQSNLAETYVALENHAAAIDVYRRYLERHPDDTRVRSRLEELLRAQ